MTGVSRVGVAVLMLLAVDSVALAAPAAVKTKITAVTVYADRAQVTRTAKVTLSGSTKRYVIEGLPGWVDSESIRAGISKGQVLDVSVKKNFLVEPSEAGVRRADEELLEVSDQLAEISDEEAVIKAEVRQLEQIRAFSMDKLPKDMVTRDVKVKTFADTVEFVTARYRKNKAALRELSRRRRALQPTLVARTKARDERRAKSQLEQQSVTVDVSGRGTATLTLTYLTPGATWEPTGELRVTGGGERVQVTQVASVVQTTGEDWTGAKLTFSTQRPEETLAVPEVQALLLGGGGGGGLNEAVSRASASFQRAQSSYSSQSTLANRHNKAWQDNFVRQNEQQQRAAAAFAEIKKRGTTAHFSALAQRTVRGDGDPVRVPIAAGQFDARVRFVAVPEVSLNVVRSAELTNSAELPILPGRATLFVDGAFVGSSRFPFVAPGESFSTFLGVHESVKLERKIDRKRSSIERKRKRTTVDASFIVTAENLSNNPVTVELGDRVPVAQNEDIELDDVEIPKQAKRSRDGVVSWTATLAPRTKRSWRIEYTLEYPNDFLKKKRPSPANKQRKLYDQIHQFESTL